MKASNLCMSYETVSECSATYQEPQCWPDSFSYKQRKFEHGSRLFYATYNVFTVTTQLEKKLHVMNFTLTFWKFCPPFDFAVEKLEFVFRVDSTGCVLATFEVTFLAPQEDKAVFLVGVFRCVISATATQQMTFQSLRFSRGRP